MRKILYTILLFFCFTGVASAEPVSIITAVLTAVGVSAGPPTAWQTKALGESMNDHFEREEGWPANCLRHSYGTYRVAETGNFPLVAKEMGSSVCMIKRHYDGVTTKSIVKDYWSISVEHRLRATKKNR